jgi:hypothetical protein
VCGCKWQESGEKAATSLFIPTPPHRWRVSLNLISDANTRARVSSVQLLFLSRLFGVKEGRKKSCPCFTQIIASHTHLARAAKLRLFGGCYKLLIPFLYRSPECYINNCANLCAAKRLLCLGLFPERLYHLSQPAWQKHTQRERKRLTGADI